MLVMPDLEQIIKDKQTLIDHQQFQIDKLQKEVYTMYLRLKEFDAKKTDSK